MEKKDFTPTNHQGKVDVQNTKERAKSGPPPSEDEDPSFKEKWEHSGERQYKAGIIADEDKESN